jgi:hypothetical protein
MNKDRSVDAGISAREVKKMERARKKRFAEANLFFQTLTVQI